MPRPEVPGLATLARMYGVQTAFYDVDARRQQASPAALLQVLRALGAQVESFADVGKAIRERRQQVWRHGLDPVSVAWQGQPSSVRLRLPEAADGTLRCRLALEGGEPRHWSCHAAELTALGSAVVEGVRYRSMTLPLPSDLPLGYHRLALQWRGQEFQSLIISAPMKACRPWDGEKAWGVFLPLYALPSQRSWGAGDLSDLESLTRWVAELGGSVVATLPLLAAFLDEPFEPSPYAPASRLFWNEFYVDARRTPEMERCPQAQAIVASAQFQRELQEGAAQPLVNYRRLMALKRRVLQELGRCFFAEPTQRQADFRRFVEAHPLVEDYARFRAVGERQRAPWPQWLQAVRDGVLRPGDYDEEARRYHLYVQWLASEQMATLAASARSQGAKLYLDLPLGAHPAGYDSWRERGLLAQDVSAGAPPDTFFAKGQNWGFHPPNPEAQRGQGYSHFIACLRHHLRHAAILRIDHVMSLHHLYWIPNGAEAHEGVYVRYPAEEVYAILSLESHRHKAVIVGEDLGTVPQHVRRAMSKHGLLRSYVLQIEPTASSERPFGHIPTASVASLNTHDTPQFAAFWRSFDTEVKRKLGALDQKAALAEHRSRQKLKRALVEFLKREGLLQGSRPDEAAILQACLAYLSASAAPAVLVNLEDLWLETRPQNVPGTLDEHPNWRRKARYTFDQFRQMPEVVDVLRQVDRLRRGKTGYAASK